MTRPAILRDVIRYNLLFLRHAEELRSDPEYQDLHGRITLASVISDIEGSISRARGELRRRFGIVEPVIEPAPGAAGTGGAADGDGR